MQDAIVAAHQATQGLVGGEVDAACLMLAQQVKKGFLDEVHGRRRPGLA